MSRTLPRGLPAAALTLAVLAAGCGGGGGSNANSGPAAPSSSSTPAASTGGAGASPLAAEAQSAATGDIPDNQVFLTFRDAGAGYSLQYPEGWSQQGQGNDVTFQARNNIVHVLVSRGPTPTPAAVAAQLTRGAAAGTPLHPGPPSTQTINGVPVVKISYSTQSAPNPVTGKRVELLVDRYVYSHGGRIAVVDLGSPRGVDNVDAYRMMARSFRWA